MANVLTQGSLSLTQCAKLPCVSARHASRGRPCIDFAPSCVPADETTTIPVVNRDLEKTMIRNEGPVDRAVRALIGLVAAIAAFSVGASSGLGIVLLIVGAIMLLTAATGFCPLYRVFGNITTLGKNRV